MTNLNVNPYYDDFAPEKNYVKILFKPSFAVQARELTQLQTAIQSQISRFGQHVFKDGSIVLNGQTTTTVVSWVDVDKTAETDLTIAEKKTFIGNVSTASARVIKTANISPTVGRIYFTYQTGVTFLQDETITSDSINFSIVNTPTFFGSATVYSIVDSVFFVDGYFAFCEAQTIVLRDDASLLNARVGIVPVTSIITSEEDDTLLDPSQGTFNFSAPGADRLAISMTLSKYEIGSAVPENFIELSRYENDSLVYKASVAFYNDLEVNLARRTYDESGDYTVKPFTAKVINNINNDPNKLSLAIGAGKAYVKGFEFETISTVYKDIDKALDTVTKTNVSTQASYGDFLVVKTPVGLLNYTNNEVVDLVAGTTVIGSARVYSIQYEATNRYKLFVYDFNLNAGTTTAQITQLRRTISSWYADIDLLYYNGTVSLNKANNRTFIAPIQQEWTKTLLDTLGNSSTEFETTTQLSAIVNVSATTVVSSGAGQEFISTRSEDYLVYNSSTGTRVGIVSVTLGTNNTSATFVLQEASFNATIVAPVVYRNKREKTKSLQTLTITKPVRATTSQISLGYADGHKLVSVIGFNSSDGTITEGNITSMFEFDNGQTDELYDHSFITLRQGSNIPSQFDSVRITFSYFAHTGSTVGYFSVDSYNPIDIAYVDIPAYVSSSGQELKLRDCLDFRPRRADNSTSVVGSGIATPFERISLDYEAYLPRIDKLVLTKERKFDLIKGIPSETPSVPADLYDAMTLYVLRLPAFTSDPNLVGMSYVDNRRYTMRDIGNIDKRVEKIEYYTALSFLERQAKEEKIYDNLGIERFKNGLLVDSFSGHSVGEVNNKDYLCAINKEARTLRPRFSSYSYNYVVSALTTARKKGDLITLPIQSEEAFAQQPYATRTVNLNPYQVFSWNGTVTLDPATDTWVDTQTKPDVVVNLNGENDIYTTLVDNVNNPASSGTTWNDWQTVVRGVSVSQDLSNQLSVERVEVDGKTLETTSSAVSSSITTSTDSSSFRTGLQINRSSTTTVERNLGTKVVDVSLAHYIRSKPVRFAAKDLRPKTRLFATFDNVDVTTYCTPAIELVFAQNVTIPADVKTVTATSKSANVLLSRKNRLFVFMADGSQRFSVGETINFGTGTAQVQQVVSRTTMETNEFGDIAGIFIIPNNASTKFTTGEKAFRLTDAISARSNTAAETKYVAMGMSQSLERTIVATRVATVSVNPTQQIGSITTNSQTSVVTSSSEDTIDVTIPQQPIAILCSEDERTGWFSDGTETRDEFLLNYEDKVIVSGSGTASSTTINVNSIVGIKPGMLVSGVGIQENTLVVSVGATSIVVNKAITANISGSNNVTVSNIFQWIGVKFTTSNEPVRYTIYADGREYTTGFVGSSAYDDQLVNLGFPKTVGANPGKLFFKRSSPDVVQARLKVESPLKNTTWRFTVPCPLENDPSVAVPAPVYTITPDRAIVNEGASVLFSINTTLVADGTVLYWDLDSGSSATSADFVGASSGQVVIKNSRAEFTMNVKSDAVTDGQELFNINLRLSGPTGIIVASSQSVTILDTSRTPTYSISANTNIIEEGKDLILYVNTTGVADGTVLFYSVNGSSVTGNDFVDNTLNGSFIVINGGATITKKIAQDALTEGSETFSVDLKTTSAGSSVANTGTITIVDTSRSALYSVTANTTRVNEGASVTFTVTTDGVSNGTILYYAISGAGITASDFSDGTLTGSFVINSNTASIVKTIAADGLTEGSENFVFAVKTVSSSGTTVAESPSVTIVDTSTTVSYGVSVPRDTVNEGETVPFTIEWFAKPAGVTTLYYTLTGSTSSADYNVATSGNIAVDSSDTGSKLFNIAITEDFLTEGVETLIFQLRTGSTSGTIVATSRTVQVIDRSGSASYQVLPVTVSTPPQSGLQVINGELQVREGQYVIFEPAWENISPSVTQLYYTLSGSVNSADTPLPMSGSFGVTSTSGSYPIRVDFNDDGVLEGVENVIFQLRTGSTSGTIVATSQTVNVYDGLVVEDDVVQIKDPDYPPIITARPVYSEVLIGTEIPSNPVEFIINGTNLNSSVVVSYSIAATSRSSAKTGSVTLIPDANGNAEAFVETTANIIGVAGSNITRLTMTSYGSSDTVTIIESVVVYPPLKPFDPGVGIFDVYNIVDARVVALGNSIGLEDFQAYVFPGFYANRGVTVRNDPTKPGFYDIKFSPSLPVAYNGGCLTIEQTATVYWEITANDGSTCTAPVGTKGSCQARRVLDVVDSRPEYSYIDPIAQTFFVDSRNHPDGIYVKSIDLYFAKKSNTIPVQVQLRPTVNGYPSADKILPFATSSKTAGEITTSNNGTIATTFEFEDIVYLAPGEYSFVVIANSDEYELYTAVLGEFELTDITKRVDKQPILGSMFKSQNSRVWSPVQEEDIKFRINKCVFPVNTAVAVTYNTEVPTNNGAVPYELFYTTGEVIDFANTNIDYEFNNGDGFKPYQLGSNIELQQQKVLSTPSSLQFKTTLKTQNRDITPVIDVNRLSNVLVHNIVNNDPTGEDGPVDGNAVAKYITRRVKLANGFDATDLKVYLFANLPSGTSIKVYYKVSTASDVFFDDNNYTEMVVENAGSFNENAFVEYKYKTPFTIDFNSFALESGERFDTFAIKIVMLSASPTKVPQVRDLRVLALDD